MSASVLNQPDEFHSALRPSVWDFTSNRDRAYVRAVSSVGNSGGFAQFTTTFAHGFVAGDIIDGSSFGVSDYNVVATITAVGALTITTDIPYNGTSIGLVTRRNNNFKIKASVRAFNGDFIVFSSVAVHASGIELTCSAAHGLDGSEIILIDNSQYYDGIYGIELLTAADKIVVNATYTDTDQGSVRTSEIVGQKESQAVSANIIPYSVTGVTSSSGNARYALSTTHSFSVGDLVTGVGFTVGGYNGDQTIISVPDLVSIVTTASYSANDVGVINSSPYYIYRFNFSGILISLLYGNLYALGSANFQRPSGGNCIPYAIMPQEVFDDAQGLTTEATVDLLLDLTNARKAMLVALQHTDTQDLSVFTQENSSKQMLTDSPQKQYMSLTEEIQLYVQTDLLQVNIRAEKFDNSGASTGEVSISPAQRMLGNVLMMPVNTNLLSASESRVDVWLRNSISNAQVSEKKSVYRISGCSGLRFHFLNRRGGYDQYTFTGQRTKLQDQVRTVYVKSLPVGFGVYDRGGAVIGVVARQSTEVWSDYLNKETATWLEQLLSSSDVYVVQGGEQVPVVLTSETVVVTDSEDMVRMKVAFVYANDIITT
jgi:hypothetical protein